MSILKRMESDLPIKGLELITLAATAQRRYKVYEIPKRNGSGMRTIAQPSPEVKLLQRWVVSKIISIQPIHKSACAYIKNKKTSDHAQKHANKRFLLKMDFKNFFNSIKSIHVKNFLQSKCGLSENDAQIAACILTWKNKKTGDVCVSVGAPSSPTLTNSMLFEFDKYIAEFCKEHTITYTRYADDLAFSTNKKNVLALIPKFINQLLQKQEFSFLEINDKKTVSTSKRYQRTLVGLNLTPDGKVSIGRNAKKTLRAQLNSCKYGILAPEEIPKLRGMLAYVWSVEPTFVKSMVARYGDDLFKKLELASLCI